MKQFGLVLSITLLMGACAIGNQYNYESPGMVLPVRGPGKIGLLVIDRRPYVLNGEKSPNFVGLQRGGFGNPFNVTTQSEKPLSEEMQTSLVRALVNNNFEVNNLSTATDDPGIAESVRQAGNSRNVVVILYEWKTDAMANFALSHNVELRILGGDGSVLASTRSEGVKEVMGGAGFESGNSVAASRSFESKMNQLFSEPNIRRIMQPDNS